MFIETDLGLGRILERYGKDNKKVEGKEIPA